MRLLTGGCALLFLVWPKLLFATCGPYEAHAFEGRILTARALTAADAPASPRVDAAGLAVSLEGAPLLLVELALERRRRVAWCESLRDCEPAPRAWTRSSGKASFLVQAELSSWAERIGELERIFAPRACCSVVPTARPACALELPLILKPGRELWPLVFDREQPSEPPATVASAPPPSSSELPMVQRGPSHYERAQALYAEGPERAPEVIELLEAGLRANPAHREARVLLAITLFGTQQFDAALVEFDQVLLTGKAEGVLRPEILLLKARAFEALGRADEARDLLGAYGAFFESDDPLGREAAELSARLADKRSPEAAGDLYFLEAAARALPGEGAASLVGAVAILIRSPDFERLEGDGDLGPVIASARVHGDDVVALFFEGSGPPQVITFRGGSASAYSSNGERREEALSPARPAGAPQLRFEPIGLSSDDGTPVAAYELRPAD